VLFYHVTPVPSGAEWGGHNNRHLLTYMRKIRPRRNHRPLHACQISKCNGFGVYMGYKFGLVFHWFCMGFNTVPVPVPHRTPLKWRVHQVLHYSNTTIQTWLRYVYRGCQHPHRCGQQPRVKFPSYTSLLWIVRLFRITV